MTSRVKLAQLTSGVGALVLGLGVGAALSPWIGRIALPLTGVGLAMHAFGMWDMHRLDSAAAVRTPPWGTAAYWLCWLLLIGILGALLVRHA